MEILQNFLKKTRGGERTNSKNNKNRTRQILRAGRKTREKTTTTTKSETRMTASVLKRDQNT